MGEEQISTARDSWMHSISPLKNLVLSSKFRLSTLWGAGFVIAFFTMHLPLFSSLGGEYQPILFVLLVLLALMVTNIIRREVAFPVAGLMFALLGVSFWHATQQSLDMISLVRCTVGLIFVLGAPALIAKVPLGAFRLIVWVHVMFAIFGLVFKEGAAGVVAALGLRGIFYYDGWNAFFASEPSYAALNLAAVIALAKLKANVEGRSMGKDWIFLMGAFVLLLTYSLTGLIIAAILIWLWAGGVTKNLFKSTLFVCMGLGVLSIIYADEIASSRFGGVGVAVVDVITSGSLLPFLFIDASGSWRFLANVGGVSALSYYPLGTGSMELQGIILDVIPHYLSDIVQSNYEYGRAVDGFNAQTPLANYAVFGGLFIFSGLLFLTYMAIRSVNSFCQKKTRIFVVCYIFIGLLWQSALTAPGWWLVLGYALVIGNCPKRSNSISALTKVG